MLVFIVVMSSSTFGKYTFKSRFNQFDHIRMSQNLVILDLLQRSPLVFNTMARYTLQSKLFLWKRVFDQIYSAEASKNGENNWKLQENNPKCCRNTLRQFAPSLRTWCRWRTQRLDCKSSPFSPASSGPGRSFFDFRLTYCWIFLSRWRL